MPNFLTIQEAISFLDRSTGAIWNESHFLAVALKSRITLHATVPATTATFIIEYIGGYFEDRPYQNPDAHLAAELSEENIRDLWMTGVTSTTWAHYEPPPEVDGTVYFVEPVPISVPNIRIKHPALLDILNEWQVSQRGVGPSVITLESTSTSPARAVDTAEDAGIRRKKLDLTKERGARRRILENWNAIESLYGAGPDATQVLRFLKIEKDAKQPTIKTVRNLLILFRDEGLIPGKVPESVPGVS
ncbi:hypothetical protein SAMN05880566_101517 [Janthinobacterium sp. TND4EL3]|uniref:hypothetical protein n=1 Tax=Janthinobacterium sp. TND4EL3 TaxID=1907311 RepID=UPI0009543FE1|nr:hypothetical protein [Janthinobacterium sp. TND4EL3]SIQ03011.1 hypothetical protein SAMN05880566_101517 [Janthinobacterium sp. TND4EL3]